MVASTTGDTNTPKHPQKVFDIQGAKSRGVKSIVRHEWEGMSAEMQRQMFAMADVHVTGPSLTEVLPDVNNIDSVDGLSLVVDLDKPLVCHGKHVKALCWSKFLAELSFYLIFVSLDHMLVRPVGEGFEYRTRKSTMGKFLALCQSNEVAKQEGHPEQSTVLSFRLVPLNGALVRCPVTFACVAFLVNIIR